MPGLPLFACAMASSSARNYLSHDLMNETTAATKSMPTLRPTCRSDRGVLSCPGDIGKFMEEYRRLDADALNTREVVGSPRRDAATNQHRDRHCRSVTRWAKRLLRPRACRSSGQPSATTTVPIAIYG
ncbi:hypothetical protein MRX96_058349 [Rhipicephalus microplus]